MTSPTGEPLTVEVVTKEIIDLLQPEVKGAELTADSSLVSSGLDSVSIVSLIYKVEKRYSIVLEEDEGDDLATVGDLAVLIVRLSEAQR